MPSNYDDGTLTPSSPRRNFSVPEIHPPAGTPLAYMLKVMRDPRASDARRDRMAIAAAPYCHQRLAEKTKKVQEAELAKAAGGEGSVWGDDLHQDDDGRLRQ